MPTTQSGATQDRTRFFPEDRDLFVRGEDIKTTVLPPALAWLQSSHEVGVANRCMGHLRLRVGGGVIFEHSIDEEGWNHPHDQIALVMADLHDDAGVSVAATVSGSASRYAQTCAPTILRGMHTAHFGTYESENVSVEFSGAQPVVNAAFCQAVFAAYTALYDLRAEALQVVRKALGLTYYREAMDAIEEAAAEHNLTTIEEAVARIVGDVRLKEAAADIRERRERGESLGPLDEALLAALS